MATMKSDAKQLIQFVRKQAAEAQTALDRALAPLPRACNKGCDACCHQMVYVHSWEEELVRHFIQYQMLPNVKKEVRRQLVAWWKIFGGMVHRAPNGAPLSIAEQSGIQTYMRNHRIPCPFLVEHACSIYPVRPAVCRAHLVPDQPELCASLPGRVGDSRALVPYGQIFGPESVVLPRDRYPHALKPLAYIVTDIFRLAIPSTPMEGLVVGGDDYFG